ncbi:MAG: hypothetical protein GY696_38685 [Gammaproteobacteria bacterium]|nr:hypothetical protein [Gammaproteobacteria bacterium]
MVIIGVIVGAISISITDSRRDKLHFEARRLAARLSLAVDEAVLINQELGFAVETDAYQFLSLNDERWQLISSELDSQLREQQLPEEMEIQLYVDNLFSSFQQSNNSNKLFKEAEQDPDTEEEDSTLAVRPQIYLMSSREINPFVLLIGYDDEDPVFYQIEGSYDGKIKLEGPILESMSFALANVKNNRSGKSP